MVWSLVWAIHGCPRPFQTQSGPGLTYIANHHSFVFAPPEPPSYAGPRPSDALKHTAEDVTTTRMTADTAAPSHVRPRPQSCAMAPPPMHRPPPAVHPSCPDAPPLPTDASSPPLGHPPCASAPPPRDRRGVREAHGKKGVWGTSAKGVVGHVW